jgi:hypothetical protein
VHDNARFVGREREEPARPPFGFLDEAAPMPRPWWRIATAPTLNTSV